MVKCEQKLPPPLESQTEDAIELYTRFHAEQSISLRPSLQLKMADLLMNQGSSFLAVEALQSTSERCTMHQTHHKISKKVLTRASKLSRVSGNIDAGKCFQRSRLRIIGDWENQFLVIACEKKRDYLQA